MKASRPSLYLASQIIINFPSVCPAPNKPRVTKPIRNIQISWAISFNNVLAIHLIWLSIWDGNNRWARRLCQWIPLSSKSYVTLPPWGHWRDTGSLSFYCSTWNIIGHQLNVLHRHSNQSWSTSWGCLVDQAHNLNTARGWIKLRNYLNLNYLVMARPSNLKTPW